MNATAARRYNGARRPADSRSSGRGSAAALRPLSELSDELLFQRYQAGDESAFRMIVDRYEPSIKGFLHKRLKDDERVQDLTQDTFLRVHRARDRYDSSRKFSTWIYTIASNLLKNEYRNRSRRRETAFPDLRKESGPTRAVESDSEHPDPEQLAYEGGLRTANEAASEHLDSQRRIPIDIG